MTRSAGRAHLDERRAHLVDDQLVGELGARMGGDDDRVAALDRVDRLDHRRRLGVGRRRERADHADRLGEDDDLALGIFLDDADRLVVDNVHQGGAGLAEDLEIFAVIIAELGLLDGVAGDLLGDARAGDRPDHRADQFVHPLLRRMLDLGLRRARPRDQAGDFGGGRRRSRRWRRWFRACPCETPGAANRRSICRAPLAKGEGKCQPTVIPAQAGLGLRQGIPAFAGMTEARHETG